MPRNVALEQRIASGQQLTKKQKAELRKYMIERLEESKARAEEQDKRVNEVLTAMARVRAEMIGEEIAEDLRKQARIDESNRLLLEREKDFLHSMLFMLADKEPRQ